MPKVIIKANTFLKKRVLGAADLADAEKIFVTKGSDFLVTEVAPDRNQPLLSRLKMAPPSYRLFTFTSRIFKLKVTMPLKSSN
jgi:hypothetical protein